MGTHVLPLTVMISMIALPVTLAQGQGSGCCTNRYADTVVQSTPALGDPNNVLGPPDSVASDFENDGAVPGSVTVAFSSDPIIDGPGHDLAIHVWDFWTGESQEAFEVRVSEDGAIFASLGIVSPTGSTPETSITLFFDIRGAGLDEVRQIKIVNATTDLANPHEGPDIDAVEALNCANSCPRDLEACEADLARCSTDLGNCGNDLETVRSELDACRSDIAACESNLNDCQAGLQDARRDLDEGHAGLEEINRLLNLPFGQRSSNYTCSGELCPQIMEIINMLLDPAGQNYRRD